MSKSKIAALVLITFFVVLCSLFLGPKIINPASLNDIDRTILFSIRMPRVIVAFPDGHGARRIGRGAAGRAPEPARGPVHPRHIERRFAHGGARHHRRSDLSRRFYDPGPCLHRRNRHRRHRGRDGVEAGRAVARAASARGRGPQFSCSPRS